MKFHLSCFAATLLGTTLPLSLAQDTYLPHTGPSLPPDVDMHIVYEDTTGTISNRKLCLTMAGNMDDGIHPYFVTLVGFMPCDTFANPRQQIFQYKAGKKGLFAPNGACLISNGYARKPYNVISNPLGDQPCPATSEMEFEQATGAVKFANSPYGHCMVIHDDGQNGLFAQMANCDDTDARQRFSIEVKSQAPTVAPAPTPPPQVAPFPQKVPGVADIPADKDIRIVLHQGAPLCLDFGNLESIGSMEMIGTYEFRPCDDSSSSQIFRFDSKSHVLKDVNDQCIIPITDKINHPLEPIRNYVGGDPCPAMESMVIFIPQLQDREGPMGFLSFHTAFGQSSFLYRPHCLKAFNSVGYGWKARMEPCDAHDMNMVFTIEEVTTPTITNPAPKPDQMKTTGKAGTKGAKNINGTSITSVKGQSNGDPHFKTFSGDKFDFHGGCDLVLVDDPVVGFTVHIRTKIKTWWSYIESAVVRIGQDTLEVSSAGNREGDEKYWINGKEGLIRSIKEGTKFPLAGFKAKYHRLSENKHRFRINLGPHGALNIEIFKDFVSVDMRAPTDKFVSTRGLMGSFPDGHKLARDGQTILEDPNEFGQEWQVLDSEPKLFHNVEGPQFPMACAMPDKTAAKRKRRLGEALITTEEATHACAKVHQDDRSNCISDVLATNDKETAEAY